MKMRFCALVIFSLLLSSFQGGLAEQCGTQAGDAVCADGLCCSQYGYCGTTAEYCCTGCQSQCNADVCAGGGGGGSGEGGHISSKIFQGGLAEQCGSQAGDAVCADGLCCSQYGYCGTTAEYCCTGCQSQCNADVCAGGGGGGSGEGGHISSKIFQGGLAEQCGTQAGDAVCADGLCCSQYGYCGTTAEYCCTGCQSQCNADVCAGGGGGGSGEGGHISSKIFQGGLAEQCGTQAGDAVCADGLCCSQYGYCGTTAEYCCTGCQSQCNADVCAGGGGGGSGEGGHIGSIISSDDFDQLLPYRNDAACPAKNFYTYDAFIEAANSFPGFGTTGDTDIRKREIAAFLAQTSHETTGGWASAPGGPYSWGYCYVREINRGPYCEPNPNYPCASGQEYYGRGPIQLSWNYNYRQCGDYFKLDLLENPDLVATDPVISFKTAIWFWMTKQSPKPSCHEVITGTWNPTGVDIAAGRLPGYGTTTNIINGGLECGRGSNAQMEDRIGFYKRYCDILGVGYGDNLDCYSQSPFGNGLLVDTM